MILRHGAALVAFSAVFVCTATVSVAAPPNPPEPPPCGKCAAPPPPPTPVPTPEPTTVAPQPVVDVHLASTKVARGHDAKLAVDASTDDLVTVTIRYKSGRPVITTAKIGSTGTLVKTWTVPRNAPVGKASVKVTVLGDGDAYVKTLTFAVVK